VLDKSLAKSPTAKGSYANVQPGDCVVAFSRHDIFGIKKEIEETTQYKCCVVYGSLPPDVRAEQARRFNDPNSGYDILVASDAIGMGLNLSIKRIIFNTMFKSNGERIVQLGHSAVKQIAGRAGRRNSLFPHGEVTCRDPNDMPHLKKCMMTEIKPLEKAGLIPTPAHIVLFNQLLRQYGSRELELHETLRKFAEMATLQGDFFLCRKKSMEVVSLWLKDVTNLSTLEKFTLCMSPVVSVLLCVDIRCC
jgi:ATP-dependent RNA helicase SUPV3L1/SUV3